KMFGKLFFLIGHLITSLKKGGFRHPLNYASDSIFLGSSFLASLSDFLFVLSSSSSSSSARPLVASLNSFNVEPTALPNCGSFLGPKMISATTAITIKLTGVTAINVFGKRTSIMNTPPIYFSSGKIVPAALRLSQYCVQSHQDPCSAV